MPEKNLVSELYTNLPRRFFAQKVTLKYDISQVFHHQILCIFDIFTILVHFVPIKTGNDLLIGALKCLH